MKNFLKKILALAIILGIFGQTSINGFADYNYEMSYIKEDIKKSKAELENLKNGEKYISKIDVFISKIDDKKAKKLSEKISSIKSKLLNRDDIITKKEENILIILNYIDLKLKERKLLKAEQAKKDAFKNTLSEADTKKVNAELVRIQNNLLNRGVENFEKILGELETYTNYEEKGNFEAKVNFDGGEELGTSKIQLKLKDYITKNSGFDAQFKSRIEAIIEAVPKGEKEMKIKINAFIDYILKDQNYYVLLKDLKITDEKGVEKIKSFIEKAKEIASKNKYIHFEDKNTNQILNTLKELNPQNILKQGKTIASKPLFTAYKKVGNKYYLVPSKYGCDTAKTLTNKFDPFNGSVCTDAQYKDLLEEIADSKAEFYIDFSSKNTEIGFESKTDDMEKLEGNVVFSDKYIEEINFTAIPDQEKYPNELASFNYNKSNYINAKIYANNGKINLNLESTLDPANRFKSIDFKYNVKKLFSSELILKNRKITGKYNLEEYNDKMVGIISGKTDTSNRLSILKIENQYINSSSWNPSEMNTVLGYNFGKYSVTNKYNSKGIKADLNASFKISRDILSEANLNLEVSEKESSYDGNYNRTYTGSFMKVVDSNIELKNKNIKGKTTILNKDKEFLKITNTGRLEENKFELNNKVVFNKSPYKMAYSSFNNALNRAKDGRRISDVSTIETALQVYRVDNGFYPIDINELSPKYIGNSINIEDPDKNIEINGCKFGYRYLPYGKTKDSINANSYNIIYCTEAYGEKITGDYEKEYSSNLVLIEKNNYYINGYNTWVKKEIEETINIKPELNFNIKTDTTSNKNNINIYIDYNEDEKKMLEIELDNKSKKTYKKIDILAPLPNDTIELEDAIGNPYMY